MIMINPRASDYAAGLIPAANIKSATYHKGSGICVVSYTQKHGPTWTESVSGQAGADLYNALVAIAAGTYTSVTSLEAEPEVEAKNEKQEKQEAKHGGKHK